MERECALDADTIGYLAYGDRGTGAEAMFAGDNNAFKDLDAGLVPVYNFLVDFDRSAGLQIRKIGGRLALHVFGIKCVGGIHDPYSVSHF